MKRKVYVFQCSTNKGRFGLTYDKIGSNLPQDVCSGKWIPFKELNIDGSEPNL